MVKLIKNDLEEIHLECPLCGIQKIYFGITLDSCWTQAEVVDGWIFHFCPECVLKDEV